MSQIDRLLMWLQYGNTITPLKAWQALGIYRLGARIYDLREAGYSIHKDMIEVATAHGDIARVARYTYLGGPNNANQV